MSKTSTVKVPPQFEEIFKKSEEIVGRYFKERVDDPTSAKIDISGDRYILVRAASMSVEFFKIISELYSDRGLEESNAIAASLLFDFAHAIGKADAESFRKKMNLIDPVEKLSAGPIHFAYSGWAFVDISEESNPSPDENFLLIYDHVASFESDAWIKEGIKADHPVCIMNSGYSSGWCEVSFGIPLVSVELTCRAKGDKKCHFVMAPPDMVVGRIAAHVGEEGIPHIGEVGKYEIPGFFDRKIQEDKLRQKNVELKQLNEMMIGREVKMAEMKKRVADLEAQLKKLSANK
ncbi:MAG: 4-vinyl reductase [Patescibacteria group bacterium]|nr:4-vinyl reductase [Patescibacteria group bacterium]